MHITVRGTIGSENSSLLSCILGEIPRLSGEVKTCGTKAYVSPSAWMQSGTIQDNILLGKQMDNEKNDKVEFLHTTDLILVIKGGRIAQTSKYNEIAVKTLSKSSTQVKELKNELALIANLTHKNHVSLVGNYNLNSWKHWLGGKLVL
ncbi:hypothetical protein GUJ93_ZPchr0006g43918 [Zizania palustris]|uniref:Protein kinase domain-containing protein n=1 Tax=Zizania palustris TaxID=103762 RepID=A0A8J5VXH1_ZIZPA|nr:hypothetical protein GUJ93_ZPchr0006g43918 [Zizania palustris]